MRDLIFHWMFHDGGPLSEVLLSDFGRQLSRCTVL